MMHSEIVINKGYAGIDPMQFGYEDCAPLHSYGPAVRQHWLLHYIVSGRGVFVREGVTHHLQPGDIFVIPPYLETFYQADEQDPWRYIWVGFYADEKTAAVFSEPVIRVRGAGSIFEDMRRCRNMESGKSAFLGSRVWELAALIMEAGSSEVGYIEKALNLIGSEYMNDLSVGLIAARLNLDRSYFTTLFTQKVGQSPGKYLLNLRLEKAAELMTVYGESPTTAAMSVGYNDLYHFSRAFKNKYGEPPREYRRKRLQKSEK